MNITEKSDNFAKNLNLIRKFKGWSMAEFAAEIAIPKSTLQSVLNSGQTTLDTTLRIAHQLGIPLDTLTKNDREECRAAGPALLSVILTASIF